MKIQKRLFFIKRDILYGEDIKKLYIKIIEWLELKKIMMKFGKLMKMVNKIEMINNMIQLLKH